MPTRQPITRATATRLAVAVAAAGVAALAPSVVSAGVDQNPNAIQLGPVLCEDDVATGSPYTPTDPAAVAIEPEAGITGVAMGLSLILVTGEDPLNDHVVLDQLQGNPGKGYAKNTVLCVWPFDPEAGLWLAGDILFDGVTRR